MVRENVMMEPTSGQCGVQPSVVFLLVTLVVTSTATAMLCAAIMTDHWEYITWDRGKLDKISKNITNNTETFDRVYEVEWLLDGQVARVILSPPPRKYVYTTSDPPALFFVPAHGGIWTLCYTLDGDQMQYLSSLGFPYSGCTNYLSPDPFISQFKDESGRTDWQHRMQNLSISCALVCLIILGSSALVGAFGVMKRQISAVLVTGVMYLLAATFAMFTLTIIHFKRTQRESKVQPCGGPRQPTTYSLSVDGVAVSMAAYERPHDLNRTTEYFVGRIFTTGWSLHLGWGGVGMCVLVSVLWILLSKIMRYNPLSALLTVL